MSKEIAVFSLSIDIDIVSLFLWSSTVLIDIFNSKIYILFLKQEGMPTFKVLHLSDTHFDPEYQEGSNADCNEPLCCRANSGVVRSPDKRAGYWGDYRKCDTPARTIQSMLENIAYLHPVCPVND